MSRKTNPDNKKCNKCGKQFKQTGHARRHEKKYCHTQPMYFDFMQMTWIVAKN